MSENDFVKFFRPSIGTEEIDEVVECLKSGWLTTAGRTKSFEADFAKYVGAAHAVALNSCTAALHLALEAIGLKEGELVFVPAMTFAATADVVRYFNATPVLVDCRMDDFNMDMGKLAETIEALKSGRAVKGVPKDHKGFRAVMPVHYGGQVADVLECRRLCEANGMSMVEDCAHTCPAYFKDAAGNWAMAGSGADIACYSFYANKTITTGEGGMATTGNAQWADRMRVMSLHGMSKDAWKRFSKSGSWRYDIVAPGFKYNLTDIAAAIGIHQLKKADAFWEARRKVAAAFTARLAGIPGILTPVERPDRRHSWHLYAIRLVEADAGIPRDEFIDRMTEAGVGLSVHYTPLHMFSYYRERYGYVEGDMPVAATLGRQFVSLPIYPSMTDSELDKVCAAIEKCVPAKRG